MSARGLELGLRGTPGIQSQQGAAAGARVPQAWPSPHTPLGVGQAGGSGAKALTVGRRGCWDEPPSPPCPLPRPSTPPLMGHACPGLHLEGFVPGGWSQRAHTAKELEPSAYAPRGAHVWAVGVCASKATPTNTQCPAGKPTASPLTGGGSGWRLIETGGQPAPCLHLLTWKSGPETWCGPWAPGPQARPTAVDSGVETPTLVWSGAHSRETHSGSLEFRGGQRTPKGTGIYEAEATGLCAGSWGRRASGWSERETSTPETARKPACPSQPPPRRCRASRGKCCACVCLQTCACPGSARASGPSGITLPSPGPHRCPEACAQAHLWVQALGPPGRAEGTCGPWIRGKAERPAAAPPPLLGGPVGLQGGRCPQTRPWPGQHTWARVCGEAAESVHVGVWQGLVAWLAVGAGRRLVEGRAAGGKASGPSQCSAETPPHAGTRTTRQPGDVYWHHPGTRTAGRQ